MGFASLKVRIFRKDFSFTFVCVFLKGLDSTFLAACSQQEEGIHSGNFFSEEILCSFSSRKKLTKFKIFTEKKKRFVQHYPPWWQMLQGA